MPTVRKIAQEAGVSVATVSRALNNDSAISGKTREMVLAIANSCGYMPKTGRRVTTNIGFAYTGEQALAHPFEAGVLEGVVKGIEESGFNVMLLNLRRGKRRDETFTQYFMRNGVRGTILRVVAESRHVCTAIAKEGFPHVVISERFDSPKVNCIDCDSRPDSVRAVEYLVALGHRRIAFATHIVPDRDHEDRFEGFKEALAKHDLPVDESLILRHPATLAGGATVMRMAMSMPNRATAIYFADWMLAVGAVKAAHAMGVCVPDDISIVGFDDADGRHCVHPTLTAVCQDAVKLGFEAASGLMRWLSSESREHFQITASTFFEVNESTGPPPARVRRVASNGNHALPTGGRRGDS